MNREFHFDFMSDGRWGHCGPSYFPIKLAGFRRPPRSAGRRGVVNKCFIVLLLNAFLRHFFVYLLLIRHPQTTWRFHNFIPFRLSRSLHPSHRRRCCSFVVLVLELRYHLSNHHPGGGFHDACLRIQTACST